MNPGQCSVCRSHVGAMIPELGGSQWKFQCWLSKSQGCFGKSNSSRLFTHMCEPFKGSKETELVHGSPKQARNYSLIQILPKKKITKHMLQQSDTPSDRHSSQLDSYQELTDPAQVSCWHSALVAKKRADLLLPSLNMARN